MLYAQTAQPLPRISIRDDGIWIEQPVGTPRRASENSVCNSVERVEWIDSNRLALECHINPSLGEYFEFDMMAGRTTKDLLGYWFTLSPVRNKVAHVGWIPHFAPPYAKSNYLQVDGKTVYPEGSGTNENPNIAELKGGLYTGIHEFLFGLTWSLGGARIALIERVYDWQPDDQDSNAGKDLNVKYVLVVASETARPLRFEIPQPSGETRIEWTDPNALTYSTPNIQRTVRIDQGSPEK